MEPVIDRGFRDSVGFFYWNLKKTILFICRVNRTINYLSHKNSIHLSDAGYPGRIFDDLIRSVSDGGLVDLHHLTT